MDWILGPHTHRDNPLSRIMCDPGKSVEKTNTGDGGTGKRGRVAPDDVGGKSLSEKSKTVRVQCVHMIYTTHILLV